MKSLHGFFLFVNVSHKIFSKKILCVSDRRSATSFFWKKRKGCVGMNLGGGNED